MGRRIVDNAVEEVIGDTHIADEVVVDDYIDHVDLARDKCSISQVEEVNGHSRCRGWEVCAVGRPVTVFGNLRLIERKDSSLVQWKI